MTNESKISQLLYYGSLKHIRDRECDMASESRNNPLLDDVSVSMFPLQTNRRSDIRTLRDGGLYSSRLYVTKGEFNSVQRQFRHSIVKEFRS
jgi:hypothetical protein